MNSAQVCFTQTFFVYRSGDMNAIITVGGTDQVGIIAKVSGWLSNEDINIVDISQTILSGNFVMMMMADLSKSAMPIEDIRKGLETLGTELEVAITIMHEGVFSAMHRI
jgi:ACT domain-containing protein